MTGFGPTVDLNSQWIARVAAIIRVVQTGQIIA